MMRSSARLLAVLWAVASGCGTEGVGVSACRQIESARCEAALPCGEVRSVAECQRFARDNCLHGLALKDEPTNVEVTDCADAIRLAGTCADERGKSAAPASCSKKTFGKASATKICQIVVEPERTPQCAFLVPEESEPEPTELDDADAGDAG